MRCTLGNHGPRVETALQRSPLGRRLPSGNGAVTTCHECAATGGAHLTTCPFAPAPYEAVLRDVRDELRLLRRTVSYALVLLVVWMLVWAVLNGR